MDLQTVKEKFKYEVDSIKNSTICKILGWEIEICLDEFLVYVSMSPRKSKDKKYLLRINFDDYPQQAPSYVFVDRDTRQEKQEVWPQGIRHQGPPPGICTPGTREFHKHLHANEPAYQWDASKYKVVNTLMQIQILMDRPK